VAVLREDSFSEDSVAIACTGTVTFELLSMWSGRGVVVDMVVAAAVEVAVVDVDPTDTMAFSSDVPVV
jgi:hypothetical protein